MGTYNYYSAQTDKVGHFFYDMLPWYLWGNTPEEETTKLERMLGFSGIYLNWRKAQKVFQLIIDFLQYTKMISQTVVLEVE